MHLDQHLGPAVGPDSGAWTAIKHGHNFIDVTCTMIQGLVTEIAGN